MMTTHLMRGTLSCVLLAALTITLADAPALAVPPERGDELAPADAAVLIELDNLAQLRASLEQDPLMQFLRDQTPARREPAAWQAVQELLGLSGEEIFDRYFGSRVVIIGETTEDGGPGVILSRITRADGERAVERLNLQRIGEPGEFTLYQSSDGEGLLGFAEGWMALADPKHEGYVSRVLSGIGEEPALADDPQYQQWSGKIDPGFARLFARDASSGDVHVATLHREAGGLKLHYAGRSDDAAELLAKTSDAGATDFGPLPRQTLSATTLNLRDREPDPNVVAALDRLMAPSSFIDDVLPNLDAPLVTFLGEVKGDEVDPQAGFDVPVVGFAIGLRDHEAAADLDRALEGVVLMANLATMQMGLDPIELQTVDHGGVSFRSANLGPGLAQRLDEPGLRGASQLAFGRVGDWYLVTTHATFFRWCIDAENDPAARVSHIIENLALADHDRPVLTSFTRTGDLAGHIRTWLRHLGERTPHWFEDADNNRPQTPGGRAVKGLGLLTAILEHYDAGTLQLYGGEEDGTLRIDGTLQR